MKKNSQHHDQQDQGSHVDKRGDHKVDATTINNLQCKKNASQYTVEWIILAKYHHHSVDPAEPLQSAGHVSHHWRAHQRLRWTVSGRRSRHPARQSPSANSTPRPPRHSPPTNHCHNQYLRNDILKKPCCTATVKIHRRSTPSSRAPILA